MKKYFFSLLAVVVAGLLFPALATDIPDGVSVNVTQHHNNPSRDGLFIDPAFTTAAAANLTRDLNFNGAIVGNVYAQPLYIEDGPGGLAMVIAVTQSNNVYALNATTGAIIWQRNVGTPISSGLPCGLTNINPYGITSTPIVDLASRSLFFDAEVNGIGHQIFSLNVDTGATNAGWPVTLNTAVSGFDSSVQSERAAPAILGNVVYFPYGGRFGDCGNYRGRVVGVQMSNPAALMHWATAALKSGIWGPGGIAHDGTNLFVTTGNAPVGTPTFGQQEAIVRLQPGPIFGGSTTDFWAPTNWMQLDTSDADLGGSGPIVVDVPGATPSALVVALGKDGRAYVSNRNNLGGVSVPLASAIVGSNNIQAGATYRTATGTYVVHRPTSGTINAFRITATNPPTIATGWTASSSGRGSPFVTSTDGTNNMIVWAVASEPSGDQRLRGYNGDTGAVVFNGGGTNELMAGNRRFNTAIAARGRMYVAADNRVYAFGLPAGGTPTPTPTATATPTPTIPPTPTPTVSPGLTPTPTPTPPTTATPTATPPCVRFVITINGAQEVPPSGSAGTGTGTIDINTVTNQLSYNITFSGLGSAETMAHIHGFAAPGSNAGIIHNLPLGSPKIGVFNYSQADEANILNGLSYVNIHSVNFPNGEIRGQIAGPILPCSTPTPTATATATVPATATPTATAPATASPTATATIAPTPPPTPTSTPAPTATATPSPTADPNTPPGNNVNVQSPSGNEGVTFAQVTVAGTTTFTPMSPASAGQLPAGYVLSAESRAFDITTTATIAPPIDVSFRFPAINNPTLFASLRVLHSEGGVLVDRTFQSDFATKTIRARVSSLSPFVIVRLTPAQSVNLSTRMRVQTGDNVGIGGFIVTGSSPKHVLVRAIGPSLTPFGVSNALADPVLELHGPGGFATINNDNWRDDPAQQTAILATGLAPNNNLESAIDVTLNPGAYTAIARGKNNGTGVALIEVFDLSQAVVAKLGNISTRALVNTGDDIVIAGFILGSNSGGDTVVLRGIGPSLAAVGVPNVLANPTLELRDNNGVLLVSNNDWQDDPSQAAELTAAGLAPTNALEAGIATTLPPGLYTALLAGFNNATGVGVVEVYDRGAP